MFEAVTARVVVFFEAQKRVQKRAFNPWSKKVILCTKQALGLVRNQQQT